MSTTVAYPVTSTTLIGLVGGVSYTASVTATAGGSSAPASAPAEPVLVVGETAPPSEPPAVVDDEFEIVTPGGDAPAPGAAVTITGSGFEPITLITVTVYSEPIVLGTTTTDELDDFEFTLTVPEDLAAGHHDLVATGMGRDGNIRFLERDVTVAADPGATPTPTPGATPTPAPTPSQTSTPDPTTSPGDSPSADAGLAVTGRSLTSLLVGGWMLLGTGLGLVATAPLVRSARRRRRRDC